MLLPGKSAGRALTGNPYVVIKLSTVNSGVPGDFSIQKWQEQSGLPCSVRAGNHIGTFHQQLAKFLFGIGALDFSWIKSTCITLGFKEWS
jgi:hypothetical protein